MASAFVTLLVATVVLLIVYLIKKYTYWQRRGIPIAKGLIPFVGHVLPILTFRVSLATFNQNVYNEFKKYSMVGYYKLVKPVLVVREPELIKTVLQSNFSSFHENGMKVEAKLDPLLIKNPFFSYGEPWSRSRKRLAYAFSNVKLKVLHAAVSGVCNKFDNYLKKRVTSGDKYEMELKHLFSKFTGEVVANAGFGIEGYCFEDNKQSMAFDIISKPIFTHSFMKAIENLTLILPELRKLLQIRFVPKEFDQFFRNIVSENLEIRRKETTPRNDYIQLMIDLQKSSNEEVDVESVTAEALSFYFDGFETSSITLSFIGYHLASSPDVQEKLRQEVLTTMAKHGNELTFDALKEMTYMEQVISESQRRFSALGFLTKICTKTIELKGSDGLACKVEPGTEIIIPNHAIQNDPEYWPDPDVYDPERFSEERKDSIIKMTHLPFGEGPRMCVGMKMAMLQMKMCLATLMSKYKLELSSKTKVPIKISPYYFLTAPVGGLWVHISKL